VLQTLQAINSATVSNMPCMGQRSQYQQSRTARMQQHMLSWQQLLCSVCWQQRLLFVVMSSRYLGTAARSTQAPAQHSEPC
jgi:hypothetical protein